MTDSVDIDPSIAVVETVAAHEGVRPANLDPPLWESIDPTALDRLVRGERSSCAVQFRYHGYDVCVTKEDGVTVDDGGAIPGESGSELSATKPGE
ncbi:HalOD1 output domain-containing protein [Halovivax gelatinilyticus]|uniref:HalOD1 output domain-containing protein n=1 Tax=Halovivax gelatinilyticus TaxID=2961597 RepID=UPI0020CA744E|nr:HalOD1 output domain-containing protein [Halovivax gelatinilyticus]